MSLKRIEPSFDGPGRELIPIGSLAPLAGLSFEESFDQSRFDEAVTNQVAKSIGQLLVNVPGAASLTLKILQKLKTRQLHVVFSPEVHKALATGVARLAKRGNANIAKAFNLATGRYMETGEIVAGSISLASLGPAAAMAVIQAANMISTADLSKRLQDVSSKLDLLLQYRKIDQIARLERAYYEVQRLISIAPTPANRKQCLADMQRLHGELLELRSVWRQEAKIELDKIRKDQGTALVDMLTDRKDKELSRNQTHARAAAGRFRLIDYTLRLDELMLDALPDLYAGRPGLENHIADNRKVLQLFAEKTSAEYTALEGIAWTEFHQILDARLCQFEPYQETSPILAIAYEPKFSE